MSSAMDYFRAFWVGGMICLIGQLLLDRTKLTPGRILVCFVTAGVILSAIGIYEPVAEYAGAGASVPLTGFGHLLAQGVRQSVAEDGLLGAFTGGVKAAAAGITAAIFFGYLAALASKPKSKK